jgi:hypothetical protein
MRLSCLLAIALWFSIPAPAFPRQDSAEPAKTAGSSSTPTPSQSTPSQSAPAEPAPSQSSPAESAPPPVAPSESPQSQTPAEAKPSPEQKPAESVEKKPTVPRKKRHKRTPPSSGTPRKVVVREGGAREPAEQIAPGITPAEAVRQRQNVEQWLDSTDGQLQQLAQRKLNLQQQETVEQIRNYMDGARGALREGDVRRASTLAEKAHLLSDDLVKH